jgi:hypothetical protein
LGCWFFDSGSSGLWSYRGSSGTFADNSQNSTNRNCLIFLNQDLLKDSCKRRRNLSVNLVCGDFNEWFIDRYRVADLL